MSEKFFCIFRRPIYQTEVRVSGDVTDEEIIAGVTKDSPLPDGKTWRIVNKTNCTFFGERIDHNRIDVTLIA